MLPSTYCCSTALMVIPYSPVGKYKFTKSKCSLRNYWIESHVSFSSCCQSLSRTGVPMEQDYFKISHLMQNSQCLDVSSIFCEGRKCIFLLPLLESKRFGSGWLSLAPMPRLLLVMGTGCLSTVWILPVDLGWKLALAGTKCGPGRITSITGE